MLGFVNLTKNIVTHTSRATCNLPKYSNYTPFQKIWASMQTTSLQSRALNLPSLSTLNIFNLREILEKALEEGEVLSAMQSSFFEGKNVCSIIKKLNILSINRVKPSLAQ